MEGESVHPNSCREIELHLEGIGVAEGVSLALALEPGEPLGVFLVQGLPNGPVEVLQCLLLGLCRTSRKKPVVLARPPQGQETAHLPVGQERNPGFETLLLKVEGLVPDEPHAPGMARQEGLLFGSRDEAKFNEGLKCFHGFNFITNQGTPYISGLNAGAL